MVLAIGAYHYRGRGGTPGGAAGAAARAGWRELHGSIGGWLADGEQQIAANSALCSAVGNQVSNPAAASPSLLSSPSIISAAAAMFASSVHPPLPSATSLQGLCVATCPGHSGIVRYEQRE